VLLLAYLHWSRVLVCAELQDIGSVSACFDVMVRVSGQVGITMTKKKQMAEHRQAVKAK